MIDLKNIFIRALFISAIFFPTLLYSQDGGIKLIYARDVMDAKGYTNTTKAKGNVQFEADQTKFFCDSALWFRDKKTIYAYGKVQINQGDTVNLFCDSLKYYGETNISKLMGNVRFATMNTNLLPIPWNMMEIYPWEPIRIGLRSHPFNKI